MPSRAYSCPACKRRHLTEVEANRAWESFSDGVRRGVCESAAKNELSEEVAKASTRYMKVGKN